MNEYAGFDHQPDLSRGVVRAWWKDLSKTTKRWNYVGAAALLVLLIAVSCAGGSTPEKKFVSDVRGSNVSSAVTDLSDASLVNYGDMAYGAYNNGYSAAAFGSAHDDASLSYHDGTVIYHAALDDGLCK